MVLENERIGIFPSGKQYDKDGRGAIDGSKLKFEKARIKGDVEFLAYCIENTKISEIILQKFKEEDTEIKKEDDALKYTVIRKDSKKMSFLLVFKFKKSIFGNKYTFDINAVVTQEDFDEHQQEELKKRINSIRLLIYQDPVIIGTNCTINIKTNI